MRPLRLAALSLLLAAGACKKDQKVSAGEVSPAGMLAPTLVMPLRDAEKTSRIARAALTRSVAELDSTKARLEHVEGLLHLVNALDAWALQQHARAAQELQRAADNLERGAKYLHLKQDAHALAAAVNARAAAKRLQQSRELGADEFWHATDALDAELRTLGARIRRKT